MGIFSLFRSQKALGSKDSHSKKIEFYDRDFFASIVDASDSMMLYFFKGDGWIGANQTFYDTMKLNDIDEFNKKYDSVREIFLHESEEIFTESDNSWLDYIRKYKSDGYHVTFLKNNEDIATINVKCHSIVKNRHFYVLELQDITELHNAVAKAQEIEKLKTKFLANIGHEFRTPMNGILGFIELLQQTNLDKNQREFIGMINNSSKNLMTNIETLLELSQLQSGRLEINPRTFNILSEMENLTFNFCMQGSEKGIKVLTFIDPKLPQEIYSDSKKIFQIMFALVQNAIKFTPRGGKVIIEVKLLKRLQNGDCSIGFGVRDNGMGISSEQIAHISEPFTSGSHADKRLGVGLTLSYGLVHLLGSKLRIQSESGEGTYVNFVLDFKNSRGQNFKMMPKKKVKVLLLDPKQVDEATFLTIYLRSFSLDVVKSNQLDSKVYDDVDALYIVANQDDSSWMLELGTYSKKTPVVLFLNQDEKLQTKLTHLVDQVVKQPMLPSSIARHLYDIHSIKSKILNSSKLEIKEKVLALVVEDNIINQRLIQIILQGYNISVDTASDGVEGINMCSKNSYDIIFMDIDMPEKNGIEATHEIKESFALNRDTPIVALTAMAMEGDREMLLDEGMDDYLAKPLTREKLNNILNTYLKVDA